MSVAIKSTIVPSFGRHETFTIRYGWLKRAFDELIDTPVEGADGSDLFHAGDAHRRLGVGRNMAKSIRFWLQAARLAEELSENRHPDNRRQVLMTPTPFGSALLRSPGGLDPYLEDLSSWWLLHWRMLSPGSHLPAWWAAFHAFRGVTFSVDQMVDHVSTQVEATAEWNRPKPPTPSTVRRDVLAMLRAYAGTAGSRKRDKIDDTVDAPFVPLTLIRATDEPETFRFGVGPKPGLAPSVAAFACLDFLHETRSTSRSVLVASLASEAGGPGRAFKLTERDLAGLLEEAASRNEDLLSIRSVGGSDTLNILTSSSLPEVAARVLYRHYRDSGAAVREPKRPYAPSVVASISAGGENVDAA